MSLLSKALYETTQEFVSNPKNVENLKRSAELMKSIQNVDQIVVKDVTISTKTQQMLSASPAALDVSVPKATFEIKTDCVFKGMTASSRGKACQRQGKSV